MSTIILDVLTKIKCCHYNFMQLFSIQGKKYTAAIPNTDIEFFYGFDWNHYWLKAKFILSTFVPRLRKIHTFCKQKLLIRRRAVIISLLIVTVVITIALGSILGKFVSHLISIVIGVARDILLEKSSIEY